MHGLPTAGCGRVALPLQPQDRTGLEERVRPRHGGSERLRGVLQSLERGADFGYRFTDAMARAPSRWPVAPGALFEKPLFERPFLIFDCVGSVRHSTRSESTALDTHFRVPPAPPLPTPL